VSLLSSPLVRAKCRVGTHCPASDEKLRNVILAVARELSQQIHRIPERGMTTASSAPRTCHSW
jgi:hypothetical protein